MRCSITVASTVGFFEVVADYIQPRQPFAYGIRRVALLQVEDLLFDGLDRHHFHSPLTEFLPDVM